MTGMQTLIYSAEILEKLAAEESAQETEEPDEGQTLINPPDTSVSETNQQGAARPETRQEKKDKADEKKKEESGLPFGVMIAFSVAIAIAFVVGVFIIVPTVAVNFLGAYTDNAVVLNLFEGILRIIFFVIYIVVISRMKEIQTTFEYHGAEHKTIHCFESGLPLTPANASGFETLHPRCGTSFLMFVMIIALLLFSLLGWPDLLLRILSRIIFIPLIAGLSYELLRYAGSSDTALVRILSVPGLLLQKLTTRNPDNSQLELAIAALKAVIVPAETPVIEGFCDNDGQLRPEEDTPALLIPERSASERQIPEGDAPEIQISEEDTTEMQIPEKDTTEIQIPDEDTTEIQIPKGDTPEMQIPEKDTTERQIPEGDASEMQIPEKNTTEIQISDEDTTDPQNVQEDSSGLQSE
jgi:uncharacterized protein YqhQ